MKIIMFGVLYPKMENFWKEYVSCVNLQDDLDFELWFINNNFSLINNVREDVDENIKIRIFDLDILGLTGPKLWKQIIHLLSRETKKENVDSIIFTDTDDTFTSDRVSKMKKALLSEKIVFTDLIPQTSDGKIKGELWYGSSVPVVVSFKDIVSKNLLGLGHTAIYADLLSKIYPISSELVVTDWWIYASLLSQGYTAYFLKNCPYYYRQHSNTIAGVRSNFDADYIKYGLKLKMKHYSFLLKYIIDLNLRQLIQKELKKTKRLDILLSDLRILTCYMTNLNNFAKIKEKGFFWREEVDLKFVPIKYLEK